MRPIDSISVLLPTWQAMEFLERVFDALSEQECPLPWDMHVIDSGSSDGTVEFLEARVAEFPVPLHVTRIAQEEFDHGDTRNQLAAASTGELLVFLTQDAIPSRPDWLISIARNFEDPEVGAAYCRNVPREDAELLTRVFSRSDPGYHSERNVTRLPSPAEFARLSSDERRLLYNFNDVASAVRRELWERHPFPRTMMGEDVLMGRAIIHAGYSVVYDAHATVDHSHDYGPEKMHWRGEVDGRFNAEWLDRICIGSMADLQHLLGRLVEEDLATLDAEHDLGPAQRESLHARARVLREALVHGLFEGGKCVRRQYPTRMRASAELRALFVVGSGIASDGAAEIRELAHALRLRGHVVQIVHLGTCDSPAADPREAALEGEGSGAWAAAFQELLAEKSSDVVHFHGLRSSEHELVEVARLAGVSNLVSCSEGEEGLRARGSFRGRSQAGATVRPEVWISIALSRTDLCLVNRLELRDELRARYRLEERRVVHSGSLSQQTPQDQAGQLEYRYRGLVCIDRAGGLRQEVFLDCAGIETALTSGTCEPQDADYLLLHPGAMAEYSLVEPLEGLMHIEVEQLQLAGEDNITLAGQVFAGGLQIGKLLDPGPTSVQRVVRQILEVELPPGITALQFVTPRRFPWRRRYLRLTHIHVARIL